MDIASILRRARFVLTAAGAFACAAAFSGHAAAQTYPDKPVRVILGFAPGTPPDLAIRRIADPVGATHGQPVLIESKPGAAGIIGAEFVAKA
ncbi:MAG: tripartite tricarboxylate transporter substrate binding protein, partial [Pseudorhodoplanes sp.]